MKPIPLCALTAFMAIAPPNALADPPANELAETFLNLCAATRGDAAHALAVADQEGWATPPARTLQPPTFGQAHWTDLDGRVLRLPIGRRVLVVGTQADPGGHSAHSCIVIDWSRQPASTADMADLEVALERWVGGAPVKTTGSLDLVEFAFREVAGERRPLSPGDPALSADLPPPDVAEVTLFNAMGNPMIMYMSWR